MERPRFLQSSSCIKYYFKAVHTKFLFGILKKKHKPTHTLKTNWICLIDKTLYAKLCTSQQPLQYVNCSATLKVQRYEFWQGIMYFDKFLSIFNITKITASQNSSSKWKLSASHRADSSCTPGSTLPWQFIPAMIWKDQGWQSRARWKVSSASQTFTSFHLLLKRLYSIVQTPFYFLKASES